MTSIFCATNTFKIRDIMIASCNKTQKHFCSPLYDWHIFPYFWEITFKNLIILPKYNLFPLLNYEGGDIYFPKNIFWLAKKMKIKMKKNNFHLMASIFCAMNTFYDFTMQALKTKPWPSPQRAPVDYIIWYMKKGVHIQTTFCFVMH